MATPADDLMAAALRAEHAAIYGYGHVGARLDAATVGLAAGAEAAHRTRRDALALRLAGKGFQPPVSEPAYALPSPVTDQPSALRLAILIEERTAVAWRTLLSQVDGEDRRLAADGLTDCAVRATRFRKAAGGGAPLTVPFPGRAAG